MNTNEGSIDIPVSSPVQQDDYTVEALAMSEPTLIERLEQTYEWGWRDPVVGGFVEDNTPYEAADYIASLEAARAQDQQRLFHLEPKIAELEASNVDYDLQLQDSQIRVSALLKRIAELEDDQYDRLDAEARIRDLTGRIASLESEQGVDGLTVAHFAEGQAAAVKAAVLAEREACARIAQIIECGWAPFVGDIAAAIRSRPAP